MERYDLRVQVEDPPCSDCTNTFNLGQCLVFRSIQCRRIENSHFLGQMNRLPKHQPALSNLPLELEPVDII
jgi:hypothetical protein